MQAISISLKTASATDIASVCITSKKQPGFLRAFNESCGGAVYIATCNRVELYTDRDAHTAFKILCEFCGADEIGLKVKSVIYDEETSAAHLFSLCSGLESIVVGEDEILGQVKKSYMLSLQNGCTSKALNVIFQSAFFCAKRVKTETLLSKSSVSVASLAATWINRFKKQNAIENPVVLLVGASGDTGTKLRLNLETYGFKKVFCTNRKGVDLEGVLNVPYENRYCFIDDADVVVCATASPHYVFTADEIMKYIEKPKKRLFVDLAMPADICFNVEIENSEKITLADFEKIARENMEIKQNEIEHARQIISDCLGKLDYD